MRAFWDKGFTATTITDLEKATGVDRSTLYYSFGGKDGLYQQAAATYVDMADQHLFARLSGGNEGITDIVSFLETLGTELASDESPQGCLIVNDLACPADRTATDRYLQLLEQSIGSALARSAAAGETDPTKANQRTQLLSAAVIGINLIGRTDSSNELTRALVGGATDELESWSLSDRSSLSG